MVKNLKTDQLATYVIENTSTVFTVDVEESFSSRGVHIPQGDYHYYLKEINGEKQKYNLYLSPTHKGESSLLLGQILIRDEKFVARSILPLGNKKELALCVLNDNQGVLNQYVSVYGECTCTLCHRKLKKMASIRRGMGPCCYDRYLESISPSLMM